MMEIDLLKRYLSQKVIDKLIKEYKLTHVAISHDSDSPFAYLSLMGRGLVGNLLTTLLHEGWYVINVYEGAKHPIVIKLKQQWR